MTFSHGNTGQPPAYPEGQPMSQAPYSPGPQYAGVQPPADPQRYGRIGIVPWTFVQTLMGTAITLVPWLLIILASQLLAPKTATPVKPLATNLDAISAVFTFVLSAAIEAAFLLAPAYYVFRRRAPGISVGDGLRAIGFRGVSWGSAILALFTGLVTVFVASFVYGVLIETFKLPLQTNAQTLQDQARYAPLTTIAVLAVAVLVAPFCEEIFFRGYLFGGLLRGMPAWVAIILSSLLFAIAHGDIGSFAVLLVIGLVLAIMRWRLGSIWPGMLLHACNNATAAVAIFVALSH